MAALRSLEKEELMLPEWWYKYDLTAPVIACILGLIITFPLFAYPGWLN